MKVREAINKMVEKGRIGNFSIIPSHYSLHQEPGLMLQVSVVDSIHYVHFIVHRALYYDIKQTMSLLKFMNLHANASLFIELKHEGDCDGGLKNVAKKHGRMEIVGKLHEKI
jgi:hypothetical protein